MQEEIYHFFSSLPHFSMLPRDEVRQIAGKATEVTYPRDQVLAVQEKTQVDGAIVLVKGSLSLYDEKRGQHTLTGYIKPKEVFGGITILLNGGVSLRTVVADRESRGYVIPRQSFEDICTRYQQFYDYFLENFSHNIFDDSLAAIIEKSQARSFLAGVDPFSFLPEDEIERAAMELSPVQHPKDTVLFVQGRSRVGYLYILRKGSAERYYEENYQKTMRGMLSQGDIHGGISMLLNEGISVRTLRVNEPSTFYLLPRSDFMDLCARYPIFSEYFTDIFGKRMLMRSYASIIAKTVQPPEEGLQFFNRPVQSISFRKPVFGAPELTIKEAAALMNREKISSLFIGDPNQGCRGVVTEKDLARKVVASGCDPRRPVSDIMSSPVHSVPSTGLIFEALMVMTERKIRHLAVTDSNAKVIGIISNRDLLTAQGQSPVFLLREISEADTMEEIIVQQEKLPRLIRSLITSGARAENLNRFVTAVSGAVLKKIVAFTLEELGPPPARFAFMILGSEGRNEQTLKTDQDNAIVFEDLPSGRIKAAGEFFLRFGEQVCTRLDQAGYDFCTGDVMAKNPKWCQPLSEWKNYFSSWIHAAQPEDLLQASIFFDFRLGHGDAELVDGLRRYLFSSLKGWAGFFRHLTENALHFKPPIGFFRNFVVESKGLHRNTFDIKSAMTPVVDFARIYALKAGIAETNTLQRLHHLRLMEVLSPREHEELEKGYSFLMQLRFVRQITAVVEEKAAPDNHINPKKLTRIEQKMLKEIFNRIELFQSKMEFDFSGLT